MPISDLGDEIPDRLVYLDQVRPIIKYAKANNLTRQADSRRSLLPTRRFLPKRNLPIASYVFGFFGYISR